jgi:heptosyltransferase-2
VIQQKMIGDVLTSSILFEALRAKYPKAELHYLINIHTFPVVQHNPFVDKFQFFSPKEEKSKVALIKFAKNIRDERFDVVIDVYSKLSSNLITLYTGAKIRISKHKWYSSFLYTHPIKDKSKSSTKAGLAIENRLGLLKSLDIPQQVIAPKIYLTKNEISNAKKYLTKNGIQMDKPIFMIGLLGSGENKTYPFDYMARVIDLIADKKPDCQILFNYIPKQATDAKSIFDLCSDKTKARINFDVYGRSLREFMGITTHCAALIGNEGGAVNMAKALGVPTFSIFSPWIYKEVWNIFVDDNKHSSVHLNDFKPELFKGKTESQLKKESLKLYKHFTPDLFSGTLKTYLNAL